MSKLIKCFLKTFTTPQKKHKIGMNEMKINWLKIWNDARQQNLVKQSLQEWEDEEKYERDELCILRGWQRLIDERQKN